MKTEPCTTCGVPHGVTTKQRPTLVQYARMTNTNHCPTCKGVLGDVEAYDHSNGWPVFGKKLLQWLSRPCLRCGYDWSIWKIGVPRYWGDQSELKSEGEQ